MKTGGLPALLGWFRESALGIVLVLTKLGDAQAGLFPTEYQYWDPLSTLDQEGTNKD